MELHLNDPKSKQDDMGVILVDVCLMFRDATIKRGPVRSFPIPEILVNSLPCTKCSLFVLIHFFHFLFLNRNGDKRKTRYGF